VPGRCLQGRDGQHRRSAALLELSAQLQPAAGGDEQVDYDHAGGQLVELAGRLGGVQRRGDLVALGAQEILGQPGGMRVAFGEQDQQPRLGRLGSAQRHRPGGHSLGEQAMGISRRHAVVELGLDEAELLDLVAGVHAVAARTALWGQQPIAFLPGPQRGRRDAEHLRDGADAVHRPAAHRWILTSLSPRRKPATSVKRQNLFRMWHRTFRTPTKFFTSL
jgi:hypothetical protein